MTTLNGATPEPIMLRTPGYGFDVSKSYLPVMLVIGLLAVAFTAGGYYFDFKAERSSVLQRLDKIERKLDAALIRFKKAPVARK